MKDVFDRIYQNNEWKSDESVSGTGSTLKATGKIRDALPYLIEDLGVQTMLDIPCGDFNWMNKIQLSLDKYIGADIVPELIYNNQHRYTVPGLARYFDVLDITKDKLPKSDLVLVRDLLGHFSNRDVQRALINLRDSGSKYLLSTTFPDHFGTDDIETGQWRPINLAYYFGLPEPLMLLNEGLRVNDGEFSDKSLGLWLLNEED